MITSHKRFFWIVISCFCATLLPIFILNLILLNDTLGNNRKTLLASQWQQQTHGITYAPTLLNTHLFKTLRLNDRMAEINTVVLGSSTAMGLTQQAFPNAFHIYNYAQSAHTLSAAIDEAAWLMSNTDNIKYLVIPLDWSVGWIYMKDEPAPTDLSATATMQQVQSVIKPPPLPDRMRDAISYPRVANLMEILKNILGATDSTVAFRGYFLQNSSDDYHCMDGTWAKDFDIAHRGTCTGFRFDGSATFAYLEPIKDVQSLILTAIASDRYTINLFNQQGRPDPAILNRLTILARQVELKGGKLLLFMPPLLPGMEAAFIKHPVWSSYLMRTRQILGKWAAQESIIIFDAGQSERFGCNTAEFADEHHALSTCYEKVFSAFWNTYSRNKGSDIAWPPGGHY